MKKYLPLLSVLLFSQLVIAYKPDEQALRELKTELWNKAYRTQDTELLGQILHPTFQMINAEAKSPHVTMNYNGSAKTLGIHPTSNTK